MCADMYICVYIYIYMLSCSKQLWGRCWCVVSSMCQSRCFLNVVSWRKQLTSGCVVSTLFPKLVVWTLFPPSLFPNLVIWRLFPPLLFQHCFLVPLFDHCFLPSLSQRCFLISLFRRCLLPCCFKVVS